jgi:hypothetical protein
MGKKKPSNHTYREKKVNDEDARADFLIEEHPFYEKNSRRLER